MKTLFILLRWGPATALSLFCLTLVIVLNKQWWHPSKQSEPAPKTHQLDQDLPNPNRQQVTALPPRATLSATIKKPLFRKGRQPLKPKNNPENMASKRKTSPPNFQLRGVALTQGGEPIALIRSEKLDSLIRVIRGEKIGNWKIQKILSNAIFIKQGKQSLQIPLAEPGQRGKSP